MATYNWQKSSHCQEGEACLHIASTWQKSSHRAQGEACVHVSASSQTIHLTESADPAQAVLSATPTAFSTLLHSLKQRTDRY